MTQANEPNDSIRETNRRFRDLSWRVERLETSQMPSRSLNDAFDRVYDEIDALDEKIDRRFNELDQKMERRFNELDQKMERRFDELERKFNIIMRHLTGTDET